MEAFIKLLVHKIKETIRPTEKTLGRKDLKYYLDSKYKRAEAYGVLWEAYHQDWKYIYMCMNISGNPEDIFFYLWQGKKFVLLTYRIWFNLS